MDKLFIAEALMDLRDLNPLPISKDTAIEMAIKYRRETINNPTIQEIQKQIAKEIVEKSWIEKLKYKKGLIEYINLSNEKFLEFRVDNVRKAASYTDNGDILLKDGNCLLSAKSILETLKNDAERKTKICIGDKELKIKGIDVDKHTVFHLTE